MYVLLTPDELVCPEAYPAWCNLSWFQNFRNMTASVELHYHDLPEIYLWHEGKADAIIDGQPVPMRYGVMAYTAAGGQHAYIPEGAHSNTGVMPETFSGCRSGHLHVHETGESPQPEVPSFWVAPEQNPFAAPMDMPRCCFARHVVCGRFADAQTILKRHSEGWLALLVREGRIGIRADGHVMDAPENHLFLASQGVELDVSSSGMSEAALVEGWPDWT